MSNIGPKPDEAELQAYVDAIAGDMETGLDGLNRAATLESELPYTETGKLLRRIVKAGRHTRRDASAISMGH